MSKEILTFCERNEYTLISLEDKVYINNWLQVLFEGYYPELAKTICFESPEVYVTTLLQLEDALLMKTTYRNDEVIFILVDFPEINGMMEVELIQILMHHMQLIKANFQLPVIPCIIFQTERDYEVVLALLNVFPYELALLINYFSLVYEM